VRDGLLTLWQVIDDTPGQRALLGLTDEQHDGGLAQPGA
jgi:hypothetical protein